MAKVYAGVNYPEAAFEAAWHPLLLSQHHDCWIVPYNGRTGNTWADKVVKWTGTTNRISDSIIALSASKLVSAGIKKNDTKYIRVYNTLGVNRSELVTVEFPAGWDNKDVSVLNNNDQKVISQIISDTASTVKKIAFKANVSSIGYSTYQLCAQRSAIAAKGVTVGVQKNGDYKVESDLYTIILDPSKGGAIKSLLAKTLNNKEFVDKASERSFNELRGNFNAEGGSHSSTEGPAIISILEQGPAMARLQIKGTISAYPFTQILTVIQGQRRIDMHVNIDWKGSPQIGEATEQDTYRKKAFYNDKDKLLALFPLNLRSQKVYKNAPFDVTESGLSNTFFTAWDSIKNNIILNWVDITDDSNSYGMALLTDHTTNYTHGTDFPLGLTLAYSGVGLWGRDYKIDGPTDVNYSIIPHTGKWDKTGLWTEGTKWNGPLITKMLNAAPLANDRNRSMVTVQGTGLEITALKFDGNDLLIRLFNAESDNAERKIAFNGKTDRAELVELNGQKRQDLKLTKDGIDKTVVTVTVPRFGIRTIKFVNAVRSNGMLH